MVQQSLSSVAKYIAIRPKYDNFIGGEWVAPSDGRYFQNTSPIDGSVICEIARSNAVDVELALDAAHAAAPAWGRSSPAERARVLNRIADRMEERLDLLALVETIDNGKPIRETKAADLPLAVDHFRYFAGCIRAQEGALSEIDHDTVAYHFHEPLGALTSADHGVLDVPEQVSSMSPVYTGGKVRPLRLGQDFDQITAAHNTDELATVHDGHTLDGLLGE